MKSLLSKDKLITLYERRLQDIACLMYKVKHGLCPQSVRDLSSVNSTSYNFSGADFHIPRFYSVTYGKRSFIYVGPKLWNSLHGNRRNLPPLQSFKRQIHLIRLIVRTAYYVAPDTHTDLTALLFIYLFVNTTFFLLLNILINVK